MKFVLKGKVDGGLRSGVPHTLFCTCICTCIVALKQFYFLCVLRIGASGGDCFYVAIVILSKCADEMETGG